MKYPIGIQIFSQIRENRSVFTDKTDFIYQLVSRGSIYGSPDKPGGLSIQLCKSEKKEFYIRYSS